jgi:hypothetical protein
MAINRKELDDIYKGTTFHERAVKGFSDGGTSYGDYYVQNLANDYGTDPDAIGSNSGAPTKQEIASQVNGNLSNIPVDTSGLATANLLPTDSSGNVVSGGSGSSAGNSAASAAGGGALAGILKALGLSGSGTASGIAAASSLAALLGAAGQYKQNAAYAPTFSPPALFGGSKGTAAGSQAAGSTGFGPSGGYNYQNYAGANASTPGLGFAPRSPVSPNIPNYYTYGQGPQANFYSSGTPQVGTASTAMGGAVAQSPSAMKRGGHVKKFAMGGFNGMNPAFTRPVGAAQRIMPPRPAMPPMPARPATPATQPTAAPAGMPPHPMGGPMGGAGAANNGLGMPPQSTTPTAMTGNVMPPQPAVGGFLGGAGAANNGVPPMGAPPTANTQPMNMQRPMKSGGLAKFASGGTQQTAVANSPVLTGNMSPLKQVMQPRQAVTPSHAIPSMQAPQRIGMADGGDSRHVQGPGDGTSDSIPARLANGEYVMDAQTVSMLGNGDNGSGAKALDGFRAELRKHKGQALAKGKMAPDAKQPMQYLKGKK